jgi:CubicO group peptidase (beta-lactamase class C family)
MMRQLSRLMAIALCSCGGALSAQNVATSTRTSLDSLFAPYRSTSAPGCAAAASLSGSTVFETAAGMANLEFAQPITIATVFPIASVSKQFTALAVLLLARDGKLTLDDDVHKYLPELFDFGRRITIRHLLTHTSGLRDQFELIRVARGRLFWYHVGSADALDIVFRQRTLNHEPGADWMYSATGYMLAALIVERVSGMSFREFTHQRIFAPLGMSRTEFQDDYTQVMKDRAISYYRGAGNAWHWMMPNYDVVGPTGAVSTVGDLLKWEANFDHPVVGDAAMMREMQTNARLTSGDSTGYGLGLFLERYRGTAFITHGGDDIGYHAAVARLPEFGFAGVVLCNSNDADPSELLTGMADVLLSGKLASPAATPTARVRLTPAQLSEYAGLYADTLGRPITFTLVGDALTLGDAKGPRLLPLTERRFRRADGRTEYEFLVNGTVVVYRPSFPFRTSYTRTEPAQFTADALRAFVGSYVSDELGTSYDVTVVDGSLTMKTRWGPLQRLRAVHGDYFDGSDPVSFTRDSTGVVNGFLMQGVRLRNLHFRRE